MCREPEVDRSARNRKDANPVARLSGPFPRHALVALALVAVVLVDLVVWPQQSYPILYTIPVLLAARLTSERAVTVTAVGAILADGAALAISRAHLDSGALSVVALGITGVLAVDVAHQRKVAARLRAETERRAREAERREQQLTEFVHLISHDVTQPLASANFYAQVLQRALDKGDLAAARTHMSGIEVAVDRTDRMIRDLVEAARIEGGQVRPNRQPVALVPLAHSLLARLRGALAVDRVRVENEGDVVAEADPLLLERVLTNLIGNALKYSPETKPVVVRIGARPDEALISVADQGIGIAPDELPFLFERGYRTVAAMRTATGSGLGLYIARLLVEANGGRIWAESTPGEGSAFHVALRKAA